MPNTEDESSKRYSNCCDAEIVHAKGSFAGSYDDVCSKCRRYIRDGGRKKPHA